MPLERIPQPEGRPEDQVDPSEFWKDEPTKADGYVNIYVGTDRVLVEDPTPYSYGQILSSEVEDWLNENAGPRRAHGLAWYQDLANYDWYCRGKTSYKDHIVVQFCIKDLKTAMMFKHTWGGL